MVRDGMECTDDTREGQAGKEGQEGQENRDRTLVAEVAGDRTAVLSHQRPRILAFAPRSRSSSRSYFLL